MVYCPDKFPDTNQRGVQVTLLIGTVTTTVISVYAGIPATFVFPAGVSFTNTLAV